MTHPNLTQQQISLAMSNLDNVSGPKAVEVAQSGATFASAQALIGIAAALDRIATALEAKP